jgi:hypothetical protein
MRPLGIFYSKKHEGGFIYTKKKRKEEKVTQLFLELTHYMKFTNS